MKFLITGITGFAGPHLANLLIREGHEVWGLVREFNGREQDIRDVVPDPVIAKLKFVYGDLTNARSLDRILKDQPFDGCFHLAAQSHPPHEFPLSARDVLHQRDGNGQSGGLDRDSAAAMQGDVLFHLRGLRQLSGIRRRDHRRVPARSDESLRGQQGSRAISMSASARSRPSSTFSSPARSRTPDRGAAAISRSRRTPTRLRASRRACRSR